MTPDERNLINGLFDRMRGHGAIEKDRDAEALINNTVRQIPDSAYMLVQSVLVQEHALQQADQRIQELEARVQQLEQMGSRQAAPASGGFLGGLFGGGQRAAAPQPQYGQPPQGSVPAFGRGAPMQQPQQAGGPWGGRAAQYGQPQQAAPAGGGGFMRTAMMTAAGVAGGMLLANSISGMMGGNQSTGPTAAADNDPATGANADTQQAMDYQDPANNDPGTYDTAADTGGWDMGGDSDV